MASEFERIDWIRRQSGRLRPRRRAGGMIIGIGDDAAAWKPPPGEAAVLTVDVQVEGVHFRREWLAPGAIGRRALAVAVSDLAAMAAKPGGILVSMTLPEGLEEADFRRVFRGIAEEAGEYGLEILGGNLSRGPFAIAITAVGSGRPRDLRRRQGAKPGDAIFASGFPGRARLGLELLASGARPRTRAERACVEAFRRPRARIQAAILLRRRTAIHALIDLSDGLAADLAHLLEESSRRSPVSARLDAAALADLLEDPGGGAPRDRPGLRGGRGRGSPPFAAAARRLRLDPLEAVLDGGEDYELLFTAPPRAAAEVARCAGRLGLPIRPIGSIVRGRGGIRIAGAGGERRWRPRGFDHFGRREGRG